jgi:hypothetical protein
MNDGNSGFSADTEVLTRRQGWITFGQLTYFDEVATRTPDGIFEWQAPIRIKARHYVGPMLHFRSQVFNFLVTPGHPVPVQRRGQRGAPDEAVASFREARWFGELGRSRSRGQWWRIPTTSVWTGRAPNFVHIPGAIPMRGRHHPAAPLRMTPGTWLRFLGWFVSEGWLPALEGTGNYNVVGIAQTREDFKPGIRSVLDAMGIRYSEDRTGFQANHGPLSAFLRAECYQGGHRAWHKRITRSVLEYPSGPLAAMFDAMMCGDGHIEQTGLRRYVTTSKTLADDTVEVLQKMGTQGWYHDFLPDHDSFLGGRKMGKRRTQYRVTERPGVASTTPVPVEIAYDGPVFSLTPGGIVYVRREGRTGWCGC